MLIAVTITYEQSGNIVAVKKKKNKIASKVAAYRMIIIIINV